MKTLRFPSLALATAVLSALPWGAIAVEPGDPQEKVLAELGAPAGSAVVGTSTVFFFAGGEVQLRDGRVVAVNLLSAEQLAARKAAEIAAIQKMDEAARARLARLESEGRGVYAAKKTDANFAALPADAQLTYWRSFATRYPMISVAAEIEPLAGQVEHELRLRELANASEDRLAEIEARVENAEERAARAEREARRDRYGYLPGFPAHRPRPNPPHRRVYPPAPEPSKASPPLNPVDAARSEAMAEIEAARQRAYNGGVDKPAPEPEFRTQRSR